MAGFNFTFKGVDKLQAVLSDIAQGASELRPLLLQLDQVMRRQVATTFRLQREPDTGYAWKPLSPVTIEMRRKGRRKGGSGIKILQSTGRLRASILGRMPDITEDSVTLGTNVVYSRIHQEGGYAGRNHKVYIPSRRFLAMSREMERELQEYAYKYFEYRARKRAA